MIEWFVLGLIWAWTLVALLAALLLFFDMLRNPPEWWVRRHIPDEVPDDFGPLRHVERKS